MLVKHLNHLEKTTGALVILMARSCVTNPSPYPNQPQTILPHQSYPNFY